MGAYWWSKKSGDEDIGFQRKFDSGKSYLLLETKDTTVPLIVECIYLKFVACSRHNSKGNHNFHIKSLFCTCNCKKGACD